MFRCLEKEEDWWFSYNAGCQGLGALSGTGCHMVNFEKDIK